MANTINNFLHSDGNVYGASPYPVFDVYAAAGRAPLAHEAAESVEIDTDASGPNQLVLRSRSKTGNEYQLIEGPAGLAEVTATKTTGYIGQSYGALLGKEEAGLAVLLAALWGLLYGYRLLGARKIARGRKQDVVAEWRRYVPAGTGPAKPVEGYELLIPQKLVHADKATGDVDVDFSVLHRRFEKGRWVGDAGGPPTEAVWDGQIRWSADTPFEELADAWLSFLGAVNKHNEKLHGPADSDEGQPNVQELLEQRLRTVALLETPQEMAAKQPPSRRLRPALKRG